MLEFVGSAVYMYVYLGIGYLGYIINFNLIMCYRVADSLYWSRATSRKRDVNRNLVAL